MRRLAVPVLRAIGVLAVVAPTVLAGCGSPRAEPAAQAVATVASTIPESLSFSAPRIGGGVIDLRQFAGKPVALWFWAPT